MTLALDPAVIAAWDDSDATRRWLQHRQADDLVSQRLKERATIMHKLVRYPRMQLTTTRGDHDMAITTDVDLADSDPAAVCVTAGRRGPTPEQRRDRPFCV